MSAASASPDTASTALDEVEARLDGIRLERDLPLAPFTTYHVGGPADLAIFPRSADEVARVVRAVAAQPLPLHLLGRGSNVLVGDRGVRGVTLLLRDLAWIRIEDRRVVVGAGADCTAVSERAAEAGLGGLEFFYGLPGSVGGAAFMNARAFGQEMSEVWQGAVVVTREGAVAHRRFAPADFRYKVSPLQESGEVAVELTLVLSPGDPAAVLEQMHGNLRHRQDNGEQDYPSCGCVFQNDRRFGAPSGQLIDRCGLKGYRRGGARVSPRHANFVVNDGDATAADLRAVMEHVRAEVERQTGHRMAFEARFLGEF